MTVFGGIVIFASFWFLALFLVLPFGQKSQEDVGEVTPGTPRGAPHHVRLRNKLLLATLISVVLWLILYWLVEGGLFTREGVMQWDSLLRRD